MMMMIIIIIMMMMMMIDFVSPFFLILSDGHIDGHSKGENAIPTPAPSLAHEVLV